MGCGLYALALDFAWAFLRSSRSLNCDSKSWNLSVA